MLNKLKQRKESGFTIIEVMIVLAIAGLILLIVFLAVPALQRSAHNTSAKNDVSGILAAVSEYADNNNGTLPPAQAAPATGTNTVYVGGTQTACTAAASTLNCSQAKLGFYTSDGVSISAGATLPAFPAQGKVIIVEKATCNGNTPALGGSTRGFIAEYTLEGGAKECQAS